MHICGLLNEEKVDIQNKEVDIETQKVDIQNKEVDIEPKKMDIQNEKVDIEKILSKSKKDFSLKTTFHIQRLFEKFGFNEVFGRSAVMEFLELKSSGASRLLSNLLQAGIIEPVSGCGKGKYKFKK